LRPPVFGACWEGGLALGWLLRMPLLGASFIDEYANLANFVGLAVSVVGFLATIIGVYKSRNAATRAAEAAEAAKEALLRSESIAECGKAMSLIEEIRGYNRAEDFGKSLERLPQLRHKLVSLRAGSKSLKEADLGAIDTAIEQLRGIESGMEKWRGGKPLNWRKYNEVLGAHSEELLRMQIGLKHNIGNQV
jgi:hypothetical protein